jgi:hypothetical protein
MLLATHGTSWVSPRTRVHARAVQNNVVAEVVIFIGKESTSAGGDDGVFFRWVQR